MGIEQWLAEHGPLAGYIILFLGSLVEGESVVLTAGFFSYKGYLSLPLIIAISFTATLFADQALFYVGRAYGPQLLEKKPKLREKADRIFYLLHKYNVWFILSFRFIYGIRTASPLVIGAAHIPILRYTVLNFIAAVIWSVSSCVAGYMLGYFFADTIETVIKKAIHYQHLFVLAVILLISFYGLYRYYKKKKGSS
jgi:membrane protein DedA with SNARE-associated domain